MKYIIMLWAGIILASSSILAQSQLFLRFQPHQATAGLIQPAFIGWDTASRVMMGGDFAYTVASNTLSRNSLFIADQTLTEADKQAILNDMESGSPNLFKLGLRGEGMLSFKVNKATGMHLALTYGSSQSAYFRLNEPTTLGLVLFGNKAYAGQQLQDQDVMAYTWTYNHIGLGTAYHSKKWHAGIRAKLLLGQQMLRLEDLDFTTLTGSLGESISFNGNYNFMNANGSGNNGIGGALDLGLAYDVNKKLQIQASVQDLGLINWEGEIYENDVDLVYEGIEVLNLTQLLDGTELTGADSLVALLIPDTLSGNRRIMLPAQVHLGGVYALSDQDRLALSLSGYVGPNQIGQSTYMAAITYMRKISSSLEIGVNAYIGGLDGWGFGLMGTGDFRIKGNHVQAYFQAPNVAGLLFPEMQGGNSFNGGIGFILGPASFD